ncbi:hypothetical protein ACQWU4_04150 [Chryseobacterium sp. MIQD13]|uniref:hypothetical protein n=1 Tax=Chryseobacterium sp. MIQD13 TaxID=3422310 RepID=UPI003D2CDAE9
MVILSLSKASDNIKEFDYLMSGIIYFSMGVYEHVPERNIINPYIHLIKMLDAAHIILERGKKTDTASSVERNRKCKGNDYYKMAGCKFLGRIRRVFCLCSLVLTQRFMMMMLYFKGSKGGINGVDSF